MKIKGREIGRIQLLKYCYLVIGGMLGSTSFIYNVFNLPPEAWVLFVDGYPSVMAIATLIYALGLHAFSAFLRIFLWLPSLVWYVLVGEVSLWDWLFYSV